VSIGGLGSDTNKKLRAAIATMLETKLIFLVLLFMMTTLSTNSLNGEKTALRDSEFILELLPRTKSFLAVVFFCQGSIAPAPERPDVLSRLLAQSPSVSYG